MCKDIKDKNNAKQQLHFIKRGATQAARSTLCNVQCTLYTEHIKQDNMHIKVQRETESVHQRNIEIDAGVQCTLTEAGVQHSRGKGWDSWGRHLPTKGKPGFTSTREGK